MISFDGVTKQYPDGTVAVENPSLRRRLAQAEADVAVATLMGYEAASILDSGVIPRGEVSVESELGKGSTFRVVIPWMRADQPVASTRLTAKLDELTRPRKTDEAEAAVAVK